LSTVRDIFWIDLPSFRDCRGILTAIEGSIDVPFEIKRIFYMYEITANRGGHAHHETAQVAIAVSGAFMFRLSDGYDSRSFTLDDPSKGLYLPPMVFLDEIIQAAPGSVCMVLASTHYEDEKYLRSYDEYLEHIQSG